ncbi:hypothetical protein TNCV_4820321 [Trichonephila clavipes]|nr:hypothetical protein TNCV_4820321 [Trichonephila clavipes]
MTLFRERIVGPSQTIQEADDHSGCPNEVGLSEATLGQLVMDLVILNPGQVAKTTSILQTSTPHQRNDTETRQI